MTFFASVVSGGVIFGVGDAVPVGTTVGVDIGDDGR